MNNQKLRTKWRATVVLAGLVAVSCADDGGGGFEGEIQFEGQQDFLPGFEQDTGWIPAESPASIRVVARGAGGLVAKARATTNGSSLMPVADSGELTSSGELLLEVSARIDTSGFEYEGVVDSFSYVIEPATTTFDPFLLDGSASVEAALPPSELARVPVPSVPGATLIVDVTGGSVTTTFRGTCAEAANGVGQYTGETTTTGVVEMDGTIEIEIPIIGTETFGPFAFSVDIPELASELDLGSRSLQTAEPAEGMPCDGDVAGTGGADTSEASTGPGSTSGPGTSSTTAGPTTGPGTSSTTTGPTSETTTPMTGSDETGMDSTESGGPMGDPSYPDPSAGDCPNGSDAVGNLDTEPFFLVCAPVCMGGICPSGATGDAVPACALSPFSSFDACMSNEECTVAGEICDVDLDVCLFEPATHCALSCEMGETCPDDMMCFGGACGYPAEPR